MIQWSNNHKFEMLVHKQIQISGDIQTIKVKGLNRTHRFSVTLSFAPKRSSDGALYIYYICVRVCVRLLRRKWSVSSQLLIPFLIRFLCLFKRRLSIVLLLPMYPMRTGSLQNEKILRVLILLLLVNVVALSVCLHQLHFGFLHASHCLNLLTRECCKLSWI